MENYKFNISLSVLNHLGRNLYRSLITVIGEAISNSWDADAKNVHIYIDREKNQLVVQDDGVGMTPDDFQNKFLMIGYSKRKDGSMHSPGHRPFIGRKGIGKLALLSCARKISILTKTGSSDLTGGTIDNKGLDEAIEDNVKPSDYNLTPLSENVTNVYPPSSNGTTIIFSDLNDGIKNRIEYLRQLIALDFRFSIFDPSFCIFVNDNKISMEDLDFLIQDTQFLWCINTGDTKDEFIKNICNSSNLQKIQHITYSQLNISGFIASVKKPSKLKIQNTKEKATID
ncbi:Histidine kinase-, DNA gyrase B-, and HSP90-like ATPase [Fibrobacter sp. UWB15]|nr:histidine kinase/DNA gyrase B/HSP90-like ATPase [Fibrobacter sp. UWB6]SHG65755.1 Histidine kinase-, DNA gyrase B-, and HSP90-like ATPase [Fibrobacter sp. UWB8]SMG44791.1 Histidine kinase-, DNA gyrase B-, and HSP90-like ATPase [Fibrobacter sp. UWB15]